VRRLTVETVKPIAELDSHAVRAHATADCQCAYRSLTRVSGWDGEDERDRPVQGKDVRGRLSGSDKLVKHAGKSCANQSVGRETTHHRQMFFERWQRLRSECTKIVVATVLHLTLEQSDRLFVCLDLRGDVGAIEVSAFRRR
jgi:hypothetical protein